MSEESMKYYRELRAEMALMWGSQSDSKNRIEEISARLRRHGEKIEAQGAKIEAQGAKIEEQGRQIAEHGRQIAEQGREINASMQETARIGGEVAALGDQMVGRLKQIDYKFGKFQGALEADSVSKKSFNELEARVRRLEDRAS